MTNFPPLYKRAGKHGRWNGAGELLEKAVTPGVMGNEA